MEDKKTKILKPQKSKPKSKKHLCIKCNTQTTSKLIVSGEDIHLCQKCIDYYAIIALTVEGVHDINMDQKDETLTDLQKKFCLEYLKDFNGKESYLRARPDCKTPTVQAAKLLQYPKIKKYLKALTTLNYEEVINDSNKVLEMASKALTLNPKDYMSWDKLGVYLKSSDEISDELAKFMSSIKETKDGISIEFMKKDKMLELFFKYHGLINQKLELTGKDGKPIKLQHEYNYDLSKLTEDEIDMFEDLLEKMSPDEDNE